MLNYHLPWRLCLRTLSGTGFNGHSNPSSVNSCVHRQDYLPVSMAQMEIERGEENHGKCVLAAAIFLPGQQFSCKNQHVVQERKKGEIVCSAVESQGWQGWITLGSLNAGPWVAGSVTWRYCSNIRKRIIKLDTCPWLQWKDFIYFFPICLFWT